jgi:hypothetical protein
VIPDAPTLCLDCIASTTSSDTKYPCTSAQAAARPATCRYSHARKDLRTLKCFHRDEIQRSFEDLLIFGFVVASVLIIPSRHSVGLDIDSLILAFGVQSVGFFDGIIESLGDGRTLLVIPLFELLIRGAENLILIFSLLSLRHCIPVLIVVVCKFSFTLNVQGVQFLGSPNDEKDVLWRTFSQDMRVRTDRVRAWR